MAGETNISKLINGMAPKLNIGEYVFSTIKDFSKVNRNDTICEFKEKEGLLLLLKIIAEKNYGKHDILLLLKRSKMNA